MISLREEVATRFSAERCANCQPLTAHISDHCHLLESLQGSPGAPPLDRIVCMPLGRGNERTGVVSGYLAPGVEPSPEQIHLVSILATEITTALDSARLRARQMATLYAVDRATQERRSLDSLLASVLDTTVSGWNVEAGAILLLRDDSWDIRAHRGLEGANAAAGIGGPAFGLALRLAERALQTGQPIFTQERVSADPFASAAVLLLQTEGETLGALFLGSSEPGTFKPSQVDLMKAIASQIALAVRNAQLYTQLRQTAVIEERYRLSREMHDGVAQTLGYLGMQAERLERLAARGETDRLPAELHDLRDVIANAYLEVRETIDGLRLTVDGPGGFGEALAAHIADFTRRTGLPVDCSGSGVASRVAARHRAALVAHHPGGADQRPPPRQRQPRLGQHRPPERVAGADSGRRWPGLRKRQPLRPPARRSGQHARAGAFAGRPAHRCHQPRPGHAGNRARAAHQKLTLMRRSPTRTPYSSSYSSVRGDFEYE